MLVNSATIHENPDASIFAQDAHSIVGYPYPANRRGRYPSLPLIMPTSPSNTVDDMGFTRRELRSRSLSVFDPSPDDYDEVPAPICVLDHSDNFLILSWNSELEDLTGIQSQAVIRWVWGVSKTKTTGWKTNSLNLFHLALDTVLSILIANIYCSLHIPERKIILVSCPSSW